MSGYTRGKPRLRTEAHAGSRKLSSAGPWWARVGGGGAWGRAGAQDPELRRGDRTGGRTKAFYSRAKLERKNQSSRSRKGRGHQRTGLSQPCWTPDPGFYQSLASPGPPGPWGRGAGDAGKSFPASPSLLAPASSLASNPPAPLPPLGSPRLRGRAFLPAWGLSDAPRSH